MTHDDQCPSLEMLASFIDGRLQDRERSRIADHVSTCDDCYEVVRETGTTLQRMQGGPDEKARSSWEPVGPGRARLWWAGLAAALAVAAVVPWISGRLHAPDTYDEAVAPLVATVGERRFFTPRLAGGFRFGPLVPRNRATSAVPDDAQLEVLNALARLRAQAQAHPTDATRHAAAVGQLLAGDIDPALDTLRTLSVTRPQDHRVWVNLGAGYLLRSAGNDSLQDVARSIEATEKALALAHDSEEALTNRALALERLGLENEAKRAWQRVREVAKDRRWDTSSGQGQVGDAETRPRSPEERRRWIEETLLSEWARAQPGASAAAAHRLRESIEAIPPAHRGHLEALLVAARGADVPPSGLRSYADGLEFGAREQWERAHAAFVESARSLRAANSAFASWVDVQVAASLYYLTRYDEAVSVLDRVLASAPRSYSSLRGRALWVRGLVIRLQGDPLRGAGSLRAAADAFRDTGEDQHAALVDCLRGGALYTLGRRREAWALWKSVLAVAAALADPKHVYLAYWEIARAIQDERPYTARALCLELLTSKAGTTNVPTLRAAVDHAAARVLSRVGEHERASDLLADGERRLSGLETPLAEFFRTEIALARAEILVASDPGSAAAAALEAGRGYERVNLRFQRLVLHAVKSRALAHDGRITDAAHELEAALGGLTESPGDGVPAPLAARLATELGQSRIEQGDTEGAFLAFNASLLIGSTPSIGGALATPPTPIAAGERTVLVLVAADASPVRTLVVRPNGSMETFALEVLPPTFRALLLEARRELAAGTGAATDRATELLRPTFIATLASRPATVVIAGEATVLAFPFSALLERYTPEPPAVAMMPGLGRDPRKNASPAIARRVVAFASDARPAGARPLLLARAESEAVVSVYGRGEFVGGRRATKAAVVEALASVPIVHIAAHSSGDSRAGSPGILLQSEDDSMAFLPIDVPRNTRSRLVVLAACNSAAATDFEAAVATLPVQLVTRGADVVVATLWDIDDVAARDVFLELHRMLAHGTTAVAAVADLKRRQGDPRFLATARSLQVFVREPEALALRVLPSTS